MAAGAIAMSGADYSLATTGIAGPSGGTSEKPVGTVYFAFADKSGNVQVERNRFVADRETFKFLVTQSALDLLRQRLLDLPRSPAP
jgi:PncC family amidohydrolase